jgi:hypothetical protein
MPDDPDPAISKARELWKQGQTKGAVFVLVRRINELNEAHPTRRQKGKRPLVIAMLTGMFLTTIIFVMVLDRSPNLRWLSDADLTQLGYQTATVETYNELGTSIAGTNAAIESLYSLTLTAPCCIWPATQTNVAHSNETATASAVATPGPSG